MKILIPFFIALLGGCHAPRPTPAVDSLPVAAPANRNELRIPASVVEYTLGAYVDPKNPLIRHEAHRIQRLETEARWDLRPTALVKSPSGPGVESSGDDVESDALPQPTEPTEPTEKTEAPTPIEPSAPLSTVASKMASVETMQPPPPEPAVANEFVAAILPNASGVIDLIAIAAAENPEVNPFTVRQLPDALIHEIELKVGGIIQGPRSCILLNGRTVKIGEQFESLTLVAIESDAALFSHRQHLLRIPVSTSSTHVRLAL